MVRILHWRNPLTVSTTCQGQRPLLITRRRSQHSSTPLPVDPIIRPALASTALGPSGYLHGRAAGNLIRGLTSTRRAEIIAAYTSCPLICRLVSPGLLANLSSTLMSRMLGLWASACAARASDDYFCAYQSLFCTSLRQCCVSFTLIRSLSAHHQPAVKARASTFFIAA